jgi:DNA-binding GntR family transcriptional regulator
MADAASKAYEAIRRAILEGQYAPGSALREEQLAAEVGVSRTPVREALRRLLADGLVDSVRNSGTFVSDLSESDVLEVFELRAILEAYVSRKAAHLISEEELAELERLADAMEAATGTEEERRKIFGPLNTAFHTVILKASGSRLVEPILTRMFSVPLVPLKEYRLRRWVNIDRSNRQHREIIEALREHDPEWAALCMESHLLSTRAHPYPK